MIASLGGGIWKIKKGGGSPVRGQAFLKGRGGGGGLEGDKVWLPPSEEESEKLKKEVKVQWRDRSS